MKHQKRGSPQMQENNKQTHSTKFECNNKTGLLPFAAQSCYLSAGAGIPSPLMQFAVY